MNRLSYFKLYGLVLLVFTLFSFWLAATLLQQRQLVLDQARATVLRQAQLVSTGMAAFLKTALGRRRKT